MVIACCAPLEHRDSDRQGAAKLLAQTNPCGHGCHAVHMQPCAISLLLQPSDIEAACKQSPLAT